MSDERLRVAVVSDAPDFLDQAAKSLVGCELIHISPSNASRDECQYCQDNGHFHRPIQRCEGLGCDYWIIDAQDLPQKERREITNLLGKPVQRIAVGDRSLNNLLAKTHILNLDHVLETIDSCEELRTARSVPRGLKAQLSDLPYG